MPEALEHNRLPRNFHKTFKPERQYIAAMLRYAAAGKEGDYQAIAADTGIPTGTSSGKVPAILDYCRGMGLLRLSGADRSAIKRPELTSFGRMVLLEDPFLKTAISQWIAHLNLCSPLTGADVWYQLFFVGTQALGKSFPRTKLEYHLSVVYGVERGGLIGPMIGMYEDEASFKLCGALAEDAGIVMRRSAPLNNELGRGYGAWIINLLRDHFPNQQQVTLTDLDAVSGWRTIAGWDPTMYSRVLELVERKGLISVDRHMDPWLIQPQINVEEAWKRIYDDLL